MPFLLGAPLILLKALYFYFEMQNLPSFLLLLHAQDTDIVSRLVQERLVLNGKWQNGWYSSQNRNVAEGWTLEVIFKGRNNWQIIGQLSEYGSRKNAWRNGSIKFNDELTVARRFYMQRWNCLFSMEIISYYAQTFWGTRMYLICCSPLTFYFSRFNCFLISFSFVSLEARMACRNLCERL